MIDWTYKSALLAEQERWVSIHLQNSLKRRGINMQEYEYEQKQRINQRIAENCLPTPEERVASLRFAKTLESWCSSPEDVPPSYVKAYLEYEAEQRKLGRCAEYMIQGEIERNRVKQMLRNYP
jgi:hypothetical protein